MNVPSCKSDSEKNADCEQDCTGDYADDIDKCEEKTVECMSDCDDPDDTSCMWDCEDYEYECSMSYNMCLGDCPCLEDVTDCIMDCGILDDDDDDDDEEQMECMLECQEDYEDCAGKDSPFLCAGDCNSMKMMCTSNCEENEPNMNDYLNCRGGCHEEHGDCLNGCI
jgi:hypothetical protein